MMGRREDGQGQFFYLIDLDNVIPPNHLVRQQTTLVVKMKANSPPS